MDSQGWKVGDVLRNTFEVTGKLGEGGMGTVYKIRGCGETTDYAVKCPKPKIFSRVDGKENFIRWATGGGAGCP